MKKQKSTTQQSQKQTQTKSTSVKVPAATESDIGLTLFAEAKIAAQKQRHECLDTAFTAALNVIDDILTDTNKAPEQKLFPAKLAIDAYLTKERLLREDARYDLEKEKIQIERAKLSVPGGPLYIIQQNIENQQNNTNVSTTSTARDDLISRKKMQAALLEKISGIAQFAEVDVDKKE